MGELKMRLSTRWAISLMILSLLFLVAWSLTTNESTNNGTSETGHSAKSGTGHNNESEEGGEQQWSPNNGAVVHIGNAHGDASFSADAGNHWKLYVDRSRYSTLKTVFWMRWYVAWNRTLRELSLFWPGAIMKRWQKQIPLSSLPHQLRSHP